MTLPKFASPAQYFPKYIQKWLLVHSKSVTFHSFGVSGQSTVDMMKDRKTQIYPLFSHSDDTVNVFIANEDINSILNDTISAVDNYNLFNTYFSEAKAAGADYCIYWNTPYPRKITDSTYSNTTWTDALFAEQKKFFDMVNAVFPTGVDWVVNLRNDRILGGAQGQKYKVTYNHDSVHDNPIGYDSLGQYIIDQGLLKLFRLKSDPIITEIEPNYVSKVPKLVAMYDIQGCIVESTQSGAFAIAVYSNGERRKIIIP